MSNHIDPGHYHKLIGARLRELRKARGMTLRTVARAAGVTIGHVSDAERASRGMPTLTTLARYAQALDVDILDILSCLKPSPSAAVSAPFAAADGISGTSQPGRSHPPGLAATGHLTLDKPFGLADVRVAAESFVQSIVAGTDVQTPGAVVGAASVCSDSPSLGVQHGPPVSEAGAVDLPAWSPCS